MKIALASAPVKNRDIAFNLQAMLEAVEQCSGRADLMLFGEAVLQGFDSLCWDYETDRHMAVALTDAPIRSMCEAARANDIAVSFGFLERGDGALYSSQIFIGADGAVVDLFRRVSAGWKEFTETDGHYQEGRQFEKFEYRGKIFATALCGDLWTEGRPEEMKALGADIVLWPVWCDYDPEEWNETIKYEYAAQAALCGEAVLLVNPYCADPDATGCAAGAGVQFHDSKIIADRPAGTAGVLITEL